VGNRAGWRYLWQAKCENASVFAHLFDQLGGRLIVVHFVGFLLAAACSLVLTRYVRNHARRIGLFDPLDDRKVHRLPVPRLGGIAIFWASTITIALLMALFGRGELQFSRPILALLGGGAAMHVWGLFDDFHPMRARFKLSGQLLIVFVVYAAGLRMTSLALPFTPPLELGSLVGAVVTVVWLVSITNAFNLVDGLDGLAGGVAVLALATFFAVGFGFSQPGAALIAAVVGGATAGFLRYNFSPATIFLGDSGSLCVGFMLAGLGLLTVTTPSGSVAIAIPAVVLGLPALDTAITIFRRFLRGDGIFKPDRGHLHHRLLDHGHSPREVAVILYAACAVLSMAGFILANHADFVLLLLAICTAAALLVTRPLKFFEFEELGEVLGRAVRQREVISRSVRFREASARIEGLDDLHDIFATIQKAFSEDRALRAEVRLRRAFLNDWTNEKPSAGRSNDEMPVWTWSRDDNVDGSCWEICMPLLSPDERRIGSLVVWEDGLADFSLSHLKAIGTHLGGQLQRKLYVFGWPLSGTLNSEGLPLLERVIRLDAPADLQGARVTIGTSADSGRSLLRRFTPSGRARRT